VSLVEELALLPAPRELSCREVLDAALVVCEHARDAAEILVLLDMLGLR